LLDSHFDQLSYQRSRQRLIHGNPKGTCGHLVPTQLVRQVSEDRTAVREIAQVILEGGKSGNRLALHLEGGTTVSDALLSIRNDFHDVAAELLERRSLGLLNPPEVVVDLSGGHRPILIVSADSCLYDAAGGSGKAGGRAVA
jgi:hypothetical protein